MSTVSHNKFVGNTQILSLTLGWHRDGDYWQGQTEMLDTYILDHHAEAGLTNDSTSDF